jgi:hypothetical protein
MTISTAGTFQDSEFNSGQTRLSLSTTGLTNLKVISFLVFNSSNYVTALSGGGVTTWHSLTKLSSSSVGGTAQLWWGVVTSTGAGTLTVTYASSIGTTYVTVDAQEFSCPGATWSLDQQQTITDSSSSTSVPYPSITGSGGLEVYAGYAVNYASSSAASSGTPSGFVFTEDADGTQFVYGMNVSGTSAPIGTWQAASGGAIAVAGLWQATVPPLTGFFEMFD